jgi:hypothetical protein
VSSRFFLEPYSVISSGDMSGNITSSVTIINRIPNLSYSVSWTGSSPVGVITVEESNDYSLNPDGSVRNAGIWNTMTLSGAAAVSGNSDHGIIKLSQVPSFAIRLVYTRTSGTGTLNAIITGKVS